MLIFKRDNGRFNSYWPSVENAANAVVCGSWEHTDFACRLVSKRLAWALFYLNNFNRNVHQCLRYSVSSFGYHLPKMWLPLAMDNISETSRHLVPLDDGSD
jgi:hypothetical protein